MEIVSREFELIYLASKDIHLIIKFILKNYSENLFFLLINELISEKYKLTLHFIDFENSKYL